MAPALESTLSSLVTNVWENKEALVFGASKARETVADRIYELCGGSQPRTQNLTSQYSVQLSRIESLPNLARGKKEMQSDAFGSYFVRFANPGASGGAESRVYINAKREHAFDVMKALMELIPPVMKLSSGACVTGMQGLAFRGRQAPVEWGSAVLLVKIADVEEAFRGRRDLIVVYLNKPLALARDLAGKLGAKVRPTWLNNDAMPMTQAVTFGISVGAEVHGAAQWKVGTSFTEVRCRLVARALVECVTGKPSATGQEDAPLKVRANPATCNRLLFVARVATLLAEVGIDPAEPWN